MAEDSDRCPWCGQAPTSGDGRKDLARDMADELDEAAESFTRRQGTPESYWFQEGVAFATMWLRGRF